jgi:hypothetical protein
MNSSKLGAIIFLLVLLFSPFTFVSALYGHEPIINVLDPNGYFHFEDFGISVDIRGTPGANCTIFTDTFPGNPQPTAAIPEGISLTSSWIVSIKMKETQFSSASITINYTRWNLQEIQLPYAVYAYVPSNNSFIKIPSTIDAAAKTITFSQTGSLFAIGGATITEESSTTLCLILVGAIFAVVVAAMLIVKRFRRVSSALKNEMMFVPL